MSLRALALAGAVALAAAKSSRGVKSSRLHLRGGEVRAAARAASPHHAPVSAPVSAPLSAGAVTAQLIVNTSCAVCVYDNVGLVYDAAGVRTAISDGLNPPEEVDIYGPSGALSYSWSVGTGATYILDTARHNEGSPAGAADVFAMSLGGSAPTTVAGLSSTASAPTPVWTTQLPGCSADNSVGGTYTGIQASDDGSLVAVQCVDSASSPPSARVYALNGQSGTIKWFFDATAADGVKVGQGQVQVTGDGSFVLFVNEQGVPTPNTAEAYVLDGRDGSQRANETIPFFITAAISDSGNYLIIGDESVAHVLTWSAATGAYAPAFDITPPAGPQNWIPWDLQVTSGPDAGLYFVVGCIAGDVLNIQVTAVDVNNAVLANFVTPRNADKLQDSPNIRSDGKYIGLSRWGDNGNLPTVFLIQVGTPAAPASVPVFNFTTPGSQFAVDVVVASTGGGAGDVVYLASGGKAVPANEFGNGGQAYSWQITVPQ